MKKLGHSPRYSLSDVKALLRAECYEIHKNAVQTALWQLGWTPEDIVDCLLKLKPSHYYKSADHGKFPGVRMDFYKAKNIKDGESIYTHFYVREGKIDILVISSFKEL